MPLLIHGTFQSITSLPSQRAAGIMGGSGRREWQVHPSHFRFNSCQVVSGKVESMQNTL